LWSDRDAAVTDCMRSAAAALGKQIADAFARPDEIDSAEQRSCTSELEPGLRKPATLDALHRESDRAAGADRVESEFVATLRGAQYRLRIAHSAERSQSKQALVLDPHPGLPERVNVLAADRTRHATLACLRARRA